MAEGFGGVSRAAGGAGASGGAERVPKSWLPAVGLGYGAVKAGEAVKDAIEGGSAMSKIEERQAERKRKREQGQP